MLGIHKAEAKFRRRASEQVRQYIRQNNDVLKTLTTQDVLHKRVCSFTEYRLRVPRAAQADSDCATSVPLVGVMLRENGYWTASATRGGKCRWLKAAQCLKVGALVDRTLCSEFQTLEELCDCIEKAAGGPLGSAGSGQRAAVQGGVRIFISTTPCISCVGAMSQFILMFPGISLEVGCGKIPIRQGWKKDAAAFLAVG
ncbi:unnamed protein product [Polarella glacialis]|uniref:CMP/dCMP-type deaminase domain-containing protein n=1 Tax=Polarella glacialis TaxID=89957 RepID=A0A813FCP9_POLGL|nr:unnamed protein product [Polarella glacialis]